MPTKKVALVTGANKGLGLEICRQLASQGITVVLAARDLAKAEAAAQQLKSADLDVHPVKLDVTDSKDVSSIAATLKDKFGGLDILVNNAGVFPESKGEKITVDTLRETYETNTLAPFALTQALLPLLKASPAGRVVNQSSILGSLGSVSTGNMGDMATPAYTSSKAALNMLTVVTALYLKDTKVKVNAAHPGWVKTEMGGPGAQIDVDQGAKTAVLLATLPDDGPTGTFTHLGKTLPW